MLEDQVHRRPTATSSSSRALCSASTTSSTSCAAYLLGLGALPDPAIVRDPVRTVRSVHRRLARAREAGRPDRRRPRATWRSPRWAGPTSTGWATRGARALAAGGPGDFVEVGVGGGGGASSCGRRSTATRSTDRQVWVADPFRRHCAGRRAATRGGLPPAGVASWPTSTWCATASLASACSTTACASCRAARRHAPGRPDRPLAVLRLGEGLGDRRGAVLDCSTAGSRRMRDRRRARRPERARRSPRSGAAGHHGADRADRLELDRWRHAGPPAGRPATAEPGAAVHARGRGRALGPLASGGAVTGRPVTSSSSSTTCAGRRPARSSRWPAPTSGASRTSTTR